MLVWVFVYDLFEFDGVDLCECLLQQWCVCFVEVVGVLNDVWIQFLFGVDVDDWFQVVVMCDVVCECGVEGLMLKWYVLFYQVGCCRGDWWKWKVDLFIIDVVFLYVQVGYGWCSMLYIDYIFGVWDGDMLVLVVKVYLGLDDKEIFVFDCWICVNICECFGLVCSVCVEYVFELGFEVVNCSSWYKLGIVVCFLCILCWCYDKLVSEVDQLVMLQVLV